MVAHIGIGIFVFGVTFVSAFEEEKEVPMRIGEKVEMAGYEFGFNGVKKAYAIQAGRELRVIVESEKVNDEKAAELSFNISQKVQIDMTYPGQVKVTVIRETRAVNIAK